MWLLLCFLSFGSVLGDHILNCGNFNHLYQEDVDPLELLPDFASADTLLLAAKFDGHYINRSLILVFFLDNELVYTGTKKAGEDWLETKVVDWFRPMQEIRSTCGLSLDPITLKPLQANSLLFREFRGVMSPLTDFSVILEPELVEAIEISGAEQKGDGIRSHFISFGLMNGVKPLVERGWHGVFFHFGAIHHHQNSSSVDGAQSDKNPLSYAEQDDNLLVVEIGSCEDNVDCAWTLISQTLQRIQQQYFGPMDEWDFVNVEMASCAESIISQAVAFTKAKIVRIVYPGAIPLGVETRVHFSGDLEPLSIPALQAGAFGCSLSVLLSVMRKHNFEMLCCTRRLPYDYGNRNDHFTVRVQTRAAIFLNKAVLVTPEPGTFRYDMTKAVVSCTKRMFPPRCDGLVPEMIAKDVACNNIAQNLIQAPVETAKLLQIELNRFLNILLGEHSPSADPYEIQMRLHRIDCQLSQVEIEVAELDSDKRDYIDKKAIKLTDIAAVVEEEEEGRISKNLDFIFDADTFLQAGLEWLFLIPSSSIDRIKRSASWTSSHEFNWLLSITAIVSNILETSPFSIRSREYDVQKLTKFIDEQLEAPLTLSPFPEPQHEGGYQWEKKNVHVNFWQPQRPSSYEIEFAIFEKMQYILNLRKNTQGSPGSSSPPAHISDDGLFLLIGISVTLEPGSFSDLENGRAIVLRLSGPSAVAAVALVLPEDSNTVYAKFAELPSGRYVVEVCEQLRGDWKSVHGSWKPRYAIDHAYRHEVGVIDIYRSDAAIKRKAWCTSNGSGGVFGPGYWVPLNYGEKQDNISRYLLQNSQCPGSHYNKLLNPYWHWISHYCIPRLWCGDSAFRCLMNRTAPILFIGDSHGRDIYMDSLFMRENYVTAPNDLSTTKKWSNDHILMRHSLQGVHFPKDDDNEQYVQFASIFIPYRNISDTLEQLTSENGVAIPSQEIAYSATAKAAAEDNIVKLQNDTIVVISAGLWELDIDQKSIESLREEEWEMMVNALQIVLDKYSGLKIVCLTIPAVNSMTTYAYHLTNEKMKEFLYARLGSRIVVVDYFQLFLPETDRVWSDSLHVGATCPTCDRLGRPVAKTTLSLLISQLCDEEE